MRCPVCGVISENPDCCVDLGLDVLPSEEMVNEAAEPAPEVVSASLNNNQSSSNVRKSTLIEFPGVNRTPVPEWRKELSERVREVQERRAREAAKEEPENSQTGEASNPQLELLPPSELPAMNPLVAAALKRIERAHQTSATDSRQMRNSLATAVAYAPAREEVEQEILIPAMTPQLVFETQGFLQSTPEETPSAPIEKSHNLSVVATVTEGTPQTEPTARMPPPKRLIVDDPNDPALNYLDSIPRTLRVDDVDTQRPGIFRRLVCGIVDLIICGLLCAPIAFAIRLTGTDLRDIRVIEILAASVVIVTFIYLTLTTALTGRTWAMRLLSLRIIDTKTGLIPTGSQSVGRSFLYLVSLGVAGLGVLFALISREGYTFHDRITRTAVIAI